MFGRKRLIASFGAATLMLTACGGGGGEAEGAASAQTSDAAGGCEFYSGKTVTFVTREAGGGYDTDTRLLAKYLEQELDATVVVENEGGAGGLIALNNLANAEPDGLTLTMYAATGAIVSYLIGAEGAQYDMPEDFVHVGLVTPSTQILFTGAENEFDDWQEVLDAGPGVRFATEGPGAGSYFLARILDHIFDLDAEFIAGFGSPSEALLSLYAGDVDFYSGTSLSRAVEIEAGDTRGLLTMSEERLPAPLEDLPTVFEFDLSAEGEAVASSYIKINTPSRAIATTADIPEERLDCLRETYTNIVTSDEFLTEVGELERDFDAWTGEELEAFMQDIYENTPDDFIELMREAYGE